MVALHGELLKLLQKREARERATPPSRPCRTSLGGRLFAFWRQQPSASACWGRIRLAGIEGVCGANAFVMIGAGSGD
jgi:hypothetical protein